MPSAIAPCRSRLVAAITARSPDRLRPANPVEFAFLDYPQEGNLRLSGQLADFVQEYRAAFRQFKAALAALHRSRESTSLMAEKFGSNQ